MLFLFATIIVFAFPSRFTRLNIFYKVINRKKESHIVLSLKLCHALFQLLQICLRTTWGHWVVEFLLVGFVCCSGCNNSFWNRATWRAFEKVHEYRLEIVFYTDFHCVTRFGIIRSQSTSTSGNYFFITLWQIHE